MKKISLTTFLMGLFAVLAGLILFVIPTSIKHHTIDLEKGYYLRKKLTDGFVDLRYPGKTLLSGIIHFRVSPGYVYGEYFTKESGIRFFILNTNKQSLDTFETRPAFKSELKSLSLPPMDMATDYTYESIEMRLAEPDVNLAWPRWREKPSK